jgi:hypothetical protein
MSPDSKKNAPIPASSYPSNEGPLRHRATPVDGNPNPVPSDDDPSGLMPRDDTPAILEKREGPKDGQQG